MNLKQENCGDAVGSLPHIESEEKIPEYVGDPFVMDLDGQSVGESLDQSLRGKKTTCLHCSIKFRVKNKTEWTNQKLICPHCGTLYCVLPPTEKKLRELQDRYFESNRDSRYLTAIQEILVSYSRSLILKNFSNLVEDEYDVKYYAHQASTFLTECYLSREDFSITTSFGGFLHWKIKQAFWGKQEFDVAQESLDQDDIFGKPIIWSTTNMSESVYERIENEYDSDKLKEYVLNMIFSFRDFCSTEVNLIRLCGINAFLTGGDRQADKFFQLYDRKGKYEFIKTLEILKQELISSSS